MSTVKPYASKTEGKKKQVTHMFDNIAGTYDFLNSFLSAGIHHNWRKKTIRKISKYPHHTILDIATGTGDFAFEAAKKTDAKKVIGLDISKNMLAIAKEKANKRKTGDEIEFMLGDSENLPFEDNFCDVVTVGFGVRNFENLEKGISEIYRVLKPNGVLAVLEPSTPKKFPVKQFYLVYFRYILPFFGRLISGDKHAYKYLNQSVEAFPEGEKFLEICKKIGYSHGELKHFTLGVCTLYFLQK